VTAATSTADQGTLGPAKLTDRHDDDKNDKSSPSRSAAPAAAPGGDSSLGSLIAPLPQPAAVAAIAPAVSAAAGDDDGDGAEIAQLAALGDGARPPRWGAPAAGAQAAAADVTAPGGQNDGAPTAADAGSAAPAFSPQPDSPIPPERANAADSETSQNTSSKETVEANAGRNVRAHGAAQFSAEAVAAAPESGAAMPADIVPDPSQKTGAAAPRNLDTASRPTGDVGAADRAPPSPPDAAAGPIAPDGLAAPAGTATAAGPAAPAGQTAAAAPSTTPPAVPIAGLAVEIAARAHAGKNRFEIRLDPPDLGRIDVRLDVDHDGKVTSRLMVERQETLDMLRRDAPQIERSLQEAGLKTSADGMQFTLRDQSFGQQNPYPRNAALAGGLRIVVPDPDLPSVNAVGNRYGGILGLGSGVDIRV
jgi:flagellar hook-length control protein FliK